MIVAFSGQYHASLRARLGAHVTLIDLESALTGDDATQVSILVTRGALDVSDALLSCLPNLTLIIKAGSGLDNIDLGSAGRRGIDVVRTGGSERSVAELTIALTLGCLRHLKALDIAIQSGDWAAKTRLIGRTLSGRRLALVGFGEIGQAVARIAVALGASVGVLDRSPDRPDKAAIIAAIGAKVFHDTDALALWAEIVSIHVPLTETTRGMIDSRFFARWEANGVLINTGRAEVVDKTALVEALNSGRLTAAGLDVHYSEYAVPLDADLVRSNVLTTPHVGAQTHETHAEIADRVVAIIDARVSGLVAEPSR